MGVHTVTWIDSKQLSDGTLAICAECCGNPSTRSWLTMAVDVVNDSKARQEATDFHLNRVSTLHESMLSALATLPSIIGKSTKVVVAPQTTPVPVLNSTSAATSLIQ